MRKIGVLIADDHTLVRQGLRKILESDPEIEIIGEAVDGQSAVESAKRLRPTVVVIDIGLAGLDGIEATKQITEGSRRGPSVLVLSMRADDANVRLSLKAGAKGYLLRDSEDSALVRAVKSLACGGSYFSPSVSRVLLECYLSDVAVEAAGEDTLSRLTGREHEVVQLISEGKTSKEIARILSLSINTVESHRKHAMRKLDLHNTAEIVRFAVRKGIVH